ncbi:MAG: transporter [Rhodothermales bacterium]
MKHAMIAGFFLLSITCPVSAQVTDFEGLSLLDELETLNARFSKIQFLHHVHPKGQWMVSHKYMVMNMSGNRNGTDQIATDAVLDQYMVAPTDMTMQMHMLHFMYGVTDDFTLMAMIPYWILSMDHQTRMGMPFTAEASGLADIKLTAQQALFNLNEKHRFVAKGTVSLPTGSIDQKGITPMSQGQQVSLPYPMQLGSGSFDVAPTLSYFGYGGNWAWSAHTTGVFRLNENENNYRLGNQFTVSAEALYTRSDWLIPGIRVDGYTWGDVRGRNPKLMPMPNGMFMVPTADPNLRSGERIDMTFNLTLHIPRGFLEGVAFALEFSKPVYQHLEGPQLETDYAFSTYLEWSWYF